MGLVVIALSRSEEKRARVKELGADFVFDPNDDNLRKVVMKAIAPKKVDIAVDSVGGPLFTQVIAMARLRRPDQCRQQEWRCSAGI
jgi:NADPH:quinone reductase